MHRALSSTHPQTATTIDRDRTTTTGVVLSTTTGGSHPTRHGGRGASPGHRRTRVGSRPHRAALDERHRAPRRPRSATAVLPRCSHRARVPWVPSLAGPLRPPAGAEWSCVPGRPAAGTRSNSTWLGARSARAGRAPGRQAPCRRSHTVPKRPALDSASTPPPVSHPREIISMVVHRRIAGRGWVLSVFLRGARR